jgi:hypothetical protein
MPDTPAPALAPGPAREGPAAAPRGRDGGAPFAGGAVSTLPAQESTPAPLGREETAAHDAVFALTGIVAALSGCWTERAARAEARSRCGTLSVAPKG